MVEFWKGDRETLRKARFIYDPRISLTDLQREIEEMRTLSERSGTGEEKQPHEELADAKKAILDL